MQARSGIRLVAGVLGLALGLPARAAEAPDLAQVDRHIARQPRYVSPKPLYGLYVFGPSAKTRVWAVLDKSSKDGSVYDILYFDRSANGDLTQPEKRIVGKVADGSVTFDVGSITDPATGETHTEIHFSRRAESDGTMFLSMKWRGKHALAGGYAPEPGPYTVFATRPEDAPVLWPGADGPLSFQRWMWDKIPVGGSEDVRVFLGHRGHGKNTFCGLAQDFLPSGAKVLATLVYTDRQGKEQRLRHELTERC
jgi:hypothetical protein